MLTLSTEERNELIGSLMWEDIDEDVRLGMMSAEGLPYARAPYAAIARDAAKKYRELRKKDLTLPRLVVDDFREYLNWAYEDAQLY